MDISGSVSIEIWKLKVYDSVGDFLHDWHNIITELYIPKYNVSFNIYNKQINIISSTDERYKAEGAKCIEKREMSVEEVSKFIDLYTLHTSLVEKKKELVPDISNILGIDSESDSDIKLPNPSKSEAKIEPSPSHPSPPSPPSQPFQSFLKRVCRFFCLIAQKK